MLSYVYDMRSSLFYIFVNCQRADSIMQRGNVPLPGESSGRLTAAAHHVDSGNGLLPLRRLPLPCPSVYFSEVSEGSPIHLAYVAIGPRRPRKGPVATCIPCYASDGERRTCAYWGPAAGQL